MCPRIKFGNNQQRTNLLKSLYHTVQQDKNGMIGVRLDSGKVGNEKTSQYRIISELIGDPVEKSAGSNLFPYSRCKFGLLM
jgi:hypothetical protein